MFDDLYPLQDGSTAQDIAKESGYLEIATLVNKHSKSKGKR